MAMNIRVFRDAADLAGAAADFMMMRAASQPSLVVALSGGTTPRTLYEILGRDPVREALGRTAITWVVGDERCVPPVHEESNSRMITETLFRDGMSIGHFFLRFRTEIGDAAAVAGEFEAQWRGQGIEGIDVALLGLGEDGHTASLFPDTPILEIERGIAAPVFVPRLGVWRVSLTLPTLRATKSKLVLASGESKREILDRCRNGEQFPITRVMEGEGEAWWLVDQKAYGD